MLPLFLSLLACGSNGASEDARDSAPAVQPPDDSPPDDSPPDDSAHTDSPPDSGTADGPLWIEHLRLAGEEAGQDIGEATLVVGPDGTSVLIDAGGALHGEPIAAALDRRLGDRALDWAILTHWHRDHVGGLAALLGEAGATVSQRIVHRGPYDLGPDAAHADGWRSACELLGVEPWAAASLELCAGPERAPCDIEAADAMDGAPWPAASCGGLLLGDLEDPGDDLEGRASAIDLGGGASLTLYYADGRAIDSGSELAASDRGVVIAQDAISDENARSVAGLIRWGDFVYTFGGDLSGGGWGSPDVESFLVEAQIGLVEAPGGDRLIGAGGADVYSAHHHGYASATSQDHVDWLMPDDGQARNAVVTPSEAHAGAPSDVVIERLGARVGGGWVWSFWSEGVAHERLKAAEGDILIEVTDAGARYTVSSQGGGADAASIAAFESVPR